MDFILKNRDLDNAIVIGHNAGRFDHHFLIPEILALDITPSIIKRGNTIIQMNIDSPKESPYNSLTFRDSYLFIGQKLADFPKTFSFPGAKTYFPYMYCHEDSYGVRLPCLPARKYYGMKNMSPADYKEFYLWHCKHVDDGFDFNAILYEYGKNDVEVLHRGIVGYIKTSLALTDWNPIVQSCTFASFSFFLIKNKHIKPKMIGIIPENGYFAGQNASKIANKHLQWIEHTEGIKLQTKLNGGEKQLVLDDGRSVRVDGYHKETNTVYEILGDFWHGNPEIYKSATMNPIVKKSMGDLYKETEDRLSRIAKQCNLKRVWKIEIKKEMATNPEMKYFFELVAHTSRLIAQDAMAGGRTQAFWTYFKATSSFKIYMMDCVSMYPAVLMKTPLPVGQPIVVTENFARLILPLPYKGFYKIDILAPKDLLHPVVWMRINGRLIYALCKACAIKEQKTPCEHSDEERMIHCTLYYTELTLALQEGYAIQKVYEVWHWVLFQDDLFRDFLSPYIQKKLEKSGLPRPNMTEDEIGEWIKDLAEKNEGIHINRDEIEDNVPMRTLAKMAINSAWRKFIEKSVKSEIGFMNIDEKLPDIFDSDRYEVSGVTEMSETKEVYNYQIKEEFARAKPFTSTVFGAITTAGGRVMLYEAIRRLKERVLYCDTDSVMFYASQADDRLQDIEGEHLGGWKSELKLGEEITEFVSVAPKLYSYKKRNHEGVVSEVTKTKGVTLDKQASYDINFTALRRLAKNLAKGKVDTITTQRPTMYKKLGFVATRMMSKVTKPVMSKVLIDKNYRTKPYGWQGEPFEAIDLDNIVEEIEVDEEESPESTQEVWGNFPGYV